MNKKNVGDLDALYFYDKIKDNKRRAVSIPKIIIKQREEEPNEEEEEKDLYENDGMNQTAICSNILNFKQYCILHYMEYFQNF